MGNHGILVIGDTVAQAFNRLYYFERAAETYIKALWTGQPLRRMSDEMAESLAAALETYYGPHVQPLYRTGGGSRSGGT